MVSAKAGLKLKPLSDPNARRVYVLNRMERELENGEKVVMQPTEEVAAVAFAKCSRTETPFDQNVFDATEESAAAFHEKWVVGFGHGSVAEHAVVKVAFEQVSQVVTKVIEDARLISITEKSSRYQIFNEERCHVPELIAKSHHAGAYLGLIRSLYDCYFEALRRLDPFMRERYPKAPDPPNATPEDKRRAQKGYEAQIKARCCDVARYLLPSASLTSFGVTANARNWLHIVVKLLSSPHTEAQRIGEELVDILRGSADMDPDVAVKEKPLPTLLKYAAVNPYQQMLPGLLSDLADRVAGRAAAASPRATPEQRVVMLRDDEFAEVRIAAALLARHSHHPMATLMQALEAGGIGVDPRTIIAAALDVRGKHDAPPRELEHAVFQHEVIMDYGAWRDVQRHRMCTPLNQTLDVSLGYDMPDEIREIGLEREYRHVMERAAETHRLLVSAGLGTDAEYAVPMGYRRRTIYTWNLRELFHFIELRSGGKGHPSYRHIAQKVWYTLDATHPDIARHIRVDLSGVTHSTLGATPKGI